MRPFLIWLIVAIAGFGGVGGYWHAQLTEEPRRVLVVVDASYSMEGDWSRVGGWLHDLSQERYASFALFTDKGKVHGWRGQLDLGATRPYAPRALDRVLQLSGTPDFESASRRILITNAPAKDLAAWSGWDIIRP
jgi:hypothetical protein